MLKVLKVYFYEENYVVKGVPYKCFNDEVNSEMVITLVNKHWRDGIESIEHGDCIPTFEEEPDREKANIRVKFRSK